MHCPVSFGKRTILELDDHGANLDSTSKHSIQIVIPTADVVYSSQMEPNSEYEFGASVRTYLLQSSSRFVEVQNWRGRMCDSPTAQAGKSSMQQGEENEVMMHLLLIAYKGAIYVVHILEPHPKTHKP